MRLKIVTAAVGTAAAAVTIRPRKFFLRSP